MTTGTTRKFAVIKMQQDERRIGLSIRALPEDEQVQPDDESGSVIDSQEGATASLGDALRATLGETAGETTGETAGETTAEPEPAE